jgi:hypothetical protein
MAPCLIVLVVVLRSRPFFGWSEQKLPSLAFSIHPSSILQTASIPNRRRTTTIKQALNSLEAEGRERPWRRRLIRNGTYALSNFQKTDAQVNGASLFTFYNSGLSTGKRDVVLFEGNDSNFASSFDAAGCDFTLSGINYTSGKAFLTLYVSDGQDFSSSDDGTLRINGTSIATGGIFQGSAVKVPGAGVSNGSLTDVETFDITSFLTPGQNPCM